MAATVFLFPGQGSQFAGMGKSLAENFPAARAVFDQADDALGFPISKLCFEGPEEDLKLTENTQPALLTVSIAALAVLQQHGVIPDYVAGHSLGEYSALVAAGSLDFSDAVRLVRQRGKFMQDAAVPGAGAMAALLKMPLDQLERVLREASRGAVVSAANYNSPDQIVIAGEASAVQRAMDLAKSAGAKKVVPLPVSAPFHCELMKPAQARLRPLLDATAFQNLKVPLVNNWQAREVLLGVDAREGLFQQIPNPVRWTDSIQHLALKGVDRWFEVGAGKVLVGLLKNILPGTQGITFGEAADVEKILQGARE